MKLRRLLFIIIFLLAFAFRLLALEQIPPGLSHDEAYNGVTALKVLHGSRSIFFEINKGIEPLIIYLESLAFAAFGVSPIAMRLVNVICGMLTVALIYPLTVRLFNRRVALLAMAGLAVSFWAIFTSRLDLRAVTLPPLLMLTLYLLWRGLNSRGKRQPLPSGYMTLIFLTLAGLALGATMYTYLSSRFVPLLVAAIFGYQLLRRQVNKWHWLGLGLLLLTWLIVFTPLANYFIENRASFSERSGQVSTLPYALNGDFGPILRHTLRTLGMFTFHGDETDRYNLDGRPVFDWLNGCFFILGLALALLRLRRPPSQSAGVAWLLLWFFFMLLPGFITDDSPHFLRTIGAMPAAYIFWALGLEAAIQRFSEWRTTLKRFSPHSAAFQWGSAFIILLLLGITLHTGYDYFIRWANAPEARAIYGADVAEAARYLQTNPKQELTAFSAEYFRDLDPFRLALHAGGTPPFALWFDGRQSLAFPPPESGLSPRYLFLTSAPPADAWQPFLQSAPTESGRDYALYHLRPPAALAQTWADTFPAENWLNVNINNDLMAQAYRVGGEIISGGKFNVLLGWQALRALPPGTDYTFLVRLKDSQDFVWAEADGNGYTPDHWQPGVLGLQQLTLRLPGDLPPQPYHLTLEVVNRQTGQPLPAAAGQTIIPLTTLIGQLASTPRQIYPEKLPNPQPPHPAVDLLLRGYALANSTARPGDSFSLALYWQVLNQPQTDYRLQFYLTQPEAGESAPPVYRWPLVAPVNGHWPTSRWPAAYWVQDRLRLPVGPDVPPGQFNLRVAWVAEDAAIPAADFNLGLIMIAE